MSEACPNSIWPNTVKSSVIEASSDIIKPSPVITPLELMLPEAVIWVTTILGSIVKLAAKSANEEDIVYEAVKLFITPGWPVIEPDTILKDPDRVIS